MGQLEMEETGRQKHDFVFIGLLVFIVIEFGFAMAIGALAGGGGVELGWFLNSTADISDFYYLEITPDDWAFAIWGVIYAWQIGWVIYVVITIFRKNKAGPVYLNPPVVTVFFLATAVLNFGTNITWLFLWDRQEMPWALGIIIVYSLSMYSMLISNHRQVDRYLPTMKKHHKWDLFWNRALIQNGIACNAAWVSIASLLNVAIVLAYWLDVSNATSCTVALSILTVEVIGYFILENFILERYLRHTYSVWAVIIWALISSITNNWDPSKTNSIFSAVLLSVACVLYVIKVALSLWRTFRKPQSVITGA